LDLGSPMGGSGSPSESMSPEGPFQSWSSLVGLPMSRGGLLAAVVAGEITNWWERVADAAVAGGALPVAVVAGVGEELADGAGFGGGGKFAGALTAGVVTEQFADDLPA
jgi:hypothetical protein